MTLGGLAIAIGELVDDAWSMSRTFCGASGRTARVPPLPVLEVIAAASQEVARHRRCDEIIIFVFVPLFALSGIEGRLFTPLGIAYIVLDSGVAVDFRHPDPVLAYFFLQHAPARPRQFCASSSRWHGCSAQLGH
jgi:HME family heavy-metal exporter